MLTLVIIAVLIVVIAVFSVQNATPIAVSFLAWHFEASLALVIVLSLLIGMVLGMALLSLLRLRRSVRERRKTAGTEKEPPYKPQ